MEESLYSLGPRTCFICLDGEEYKQLDSCCTQCYATVHKKCWQDWRKNQRLASMRSRLLGQNLPNPLSCSICRTGSARVHGIEERIKWKSDPVQERLQDELLQTIGRMLNEDEEDDSVPPLCSAPVTCMNLVVFTIVLFVDLILLSTNNPNAKIKPTAIILFSVFLMYELVVVQLITLAIFHRRNALGSLAESSTRNISQEPTELRDLSVDLESPPILDTSLSSYEYNNYMRQTYIQDTSVELSRLSIDG